MEKLYGKIDYSYDYKDGNGDYQTLESELHTSLDPWVLKINGDCQKKWRKTLRTRSKDQDRAVGNKKNLTWIGWTEDTIRTNERFIVEYTKVSLNLLDEEKGDIRKKIVMSNVYMDEIYEILRFSRLYKDGPWSYTDGTYQEGKFRDCPVFWINEDIRFTNMNDNLKHEILLGSGVRDG